ncbi:MAG: hypothetical protein K0R19_1012 [Bacillota bacterium]|jgi:hypothetical protein|nr:hypothetical protein [Bacillota bacterium]
MTGLLLKDFYSLRQYGKTMLFMLVFFAFLSAGMDNPASFFEGFMIIMSMMMAIYSFSYDNLAKWDRFGLSLPVTRTEVVAGKYLLSLILCMLGGILAFLLSSVILTFRPVEDFGLKEHLYSLVGVSAIGIFLFSILLPLIFKFGVEKSRLFLIAIFAAPTAAVISFGQLGIELPSGVVLLGLLKLLPLIAVVAFLLSFLVSNRIYCSKEI